MDGRVRGKEEEREGEDIQELTLAYSDRKE